MTKQHANRDGGPNVVEQPPAAAKPGMRLSDTALVLLEAAANRADGSVLPPPASCRARGKALERVLGSLLKTDLVRKMPCAMAEHAWRTDETDQRTGLEITDKGRREIGLPALKPPADAVQRTRGAAAVEKAAKPSAPAVSQPVVEEGCPAKTNMTFVRSEPRRRTKQAELVDLLSAPAGRGVAALGEALGWLPHTVRAALTRLRQDGFALGKDKDEAGTTVYRIEAGAEPTCSASKAA